MHPYIEKPKFLQFLGINQAYTLGIHKTWTKIYVEIFQGRNRQFITDVDPDQGYITEIQTSNIVRINKNVIKL